MIKKFYQCQVCGLEVDPDLAIQDAINYGVQWHIHRIELKGGFVQVMTCPDCAQTPHDVILSTYQKRIRAGLVEGYH